MRPQNGKGLPVGFQVGEAVEVEVGDVAQGGWCVARPAGQPVIFVRHALPGERVVARVTEVTSRFARADAIDILEPSPDRVPAPCPSARPGGCGGCDWQHATLPAQRALKAAVIGQHLRRLAGIDRAVTVEPMPGDEGGPGDEAGPAPTDVVITARSEHGEHGELAEPHEPGELGTQTDFVITARSGPPPGLGWRTRVQFAVRDDGVAGLRAHRSHEIVDIGDCLIAHPEISGLGITRRPWTGAAAVEAVVGSAGPDGPPAERAVIVTPATPGRTGAARARRAEQAGPEPDGAAGRGRPRPGRQGRRGVAPVRSVETNEEWAAAVPADAVLSRAPRGLSPIRGRAFVRQHAVGRDWRVSAGGFWQVHPAAADVLSAAVVAALEPKPGDSVLDLYCGAGLFAGAVAPLVGDHGVVTGIESDQAAVRDARHNLREWPWVRVHRGDVAQLPQDGGPPPARLAIADPPRAGLAREVIEYLSGRGRAERFVYVSCDPATLARDLGLLLERGWALEALRAFDAFPMTHHVECVATLLR
jgi:tRNA/tmRNA/rRNA uracil-C5-methylase (TrmA/RlmC/RlmD family)